MPGGSGLKVSVVVPTLNAEAHLVEALDSITSQGVDVEIIAVDSDSQDSTREILESYDLARLIVDEELSQTSALNSGFAASNGDILCWLNADDVFAPGALKFVVDFFETNPDEGLIYGDSIAMDTQGRTYGVRCNVGAGQFEELLDTDFIVQPSAFWRREVWEKAGPLREDFHYVFDYDFFLRTASEIELCYQPVVLSYERVHAAAKTSQGGTERAEEFIAMIRHHGRNEIPRAFRPEVASTHMVNGLKNIKARDFDTAKVLFAEAWKIGTPRTVMLAHFVVGLIGGPSGVARSRLMANWVRSSLVQRRKPKMVDSV